MTFSQVVQSFKKRARGQLTCRHFSSNNNKQLTKLKSRIVTVGRYGHISSNEGLRTRIPDNGGNYQQTN